MAEFDADAFLRRFAEVWQNDDVEGIAEMFTEDAVFEASFGPDAHGERAVGRAAATRLAASVFERVPDIACAPIRHYVAPTFAVIKQVQSGTPVGGARFETDFVDSLTPRDGKAAAAAAKMYTAYVF